MDLVFDLTSAGKYIWGFYDEIRDHGLIVGFFSAAKNWLLGIEPEFDEVRHTLWDSGTLIHMALSGTSHDTAGYTCNFDGDLDDDGYYNLADKFPDDPDEWFDSDSDGIGDNGDTDDDNDGYLDTYEIADGTDPFDESSLPDDYDNDLIPDSVDEDDDNDNFTDDIDAFPKDITEWQDFDSDGKGDNTDPDDDNDGFTDAEELEKGTDPLDKNDYPRGLDAMEPQTVGLIALLIIVVFIMLAAFLVTRRRKKSRVKVGKPQADAPHPSGDTVKDFCGDCGGELDEDGRCNHCRRTPEKRGKGDHEKEESAGDEDTGEGIELDAGDEPDTPPPAAEKAETKGDPEEDKKDFNWEF